MIDQPTIDRILDAANIVDVVSEFVTLRKRGVNYVGLCPFHSDKSPSFYVSPSKNICKCFACGEGGTSIHFIMKHEQLSYFDALRFLAKKYNIEIQERELSDKEKQVQSDREQMCSTILLHSTSRTSGRKDCRSSFFCRAGFQRRHHPKIPTGLQLGSTRRFISGCIKKGI